MKKSLHHIWKLSDIASILRQVCDLFIFYDLQVSILTNKLINSSSLKFFLFFLFLN